MSSNIQRRAGSIVEVLRHRAHHQGEQLAYTFLRDGEALEEHMSYGLLDHRARTLAATLLDRARPGESVLIVLQPGLAEVRELVLEPTGDHVDGEPTAREGVGGGAQRAKAKTVTVAASHVPFLSKPQEVAKVIVEAARFKEKPQP